MNTRFLQMKVRSEELNRKMTDIKWSISTMRGIVKEACFPDRDPREAIAYTKAKDCESESIGYHPSDHEEYTVTVGIEDFSLSRIYIKIRADGFHRKEQESWDHEEIDLVHANLDVIIGTCENFCQKVGRGVQFSNLITQFEK